MEPSYQGLDNAFHSFGSFVTEVKPVNGEEAHVDDAVIDEGSVRRPEMHPLLAFTPDLQYAVHSLDSAIFGALTAALAGEKVARSR